MKKIVIAAVVALFALTLCACSGQKADEAAAPEGGGEAGMINPMEESTAEGIVEATGISLPAPEGAADVQYFVYKTDNPVAELRYTVDGQAVNLRAAATGVTELTDVVYGEENPCDISGMYYDWKTVADATVGGCPAKVYTCDGVGMINWIDVVPGLVYTLSVEEGATEDGLVALANAAFVPAQGNA